MTKSPTAAEPDQPLRKRRDLFSRLAQGASFLFLAACLSITYECVQIHESKAGVPENPLADSSLAPVESNPNTPEAASKDGFFSSVTNFLGLDGKTDKENDTKSAASGPSAPPPPVTSGSSNSAPSSNQTPPSGVSVTKVKPLDFNFFEPTKAGDLQTSEVTLRIFGNKIAYSMNLNPGWGEQTRTLVDKSFYHKKAINLFIFAEPPDPMKVVQNEKYQETYAQQEVDKIAATHPMLIPFKFEQEVRSFRRRHWGSFRFVHNNITKLILYTHAGKNGKYSIVISSDKELLTPEMKTIWMSAAETFEVDLDQKAAEEPKTEEEAGETVSPKPTEK